MDTVILKNGAEEVESLVKVTMMSIRQLLKDNPIAFYELVMICRDSAHKAFGNTNDELEALALSQNGVVHSSIRNVVLSSVTGDGLDLVLGTPI